MADSGSIVGAIGEELGKVGKDTAKAVVSAPFQVASQVPQQAAGVGPSEEARAKAEMDKQKRLAETRSRLAEVQKYGVSNQPQQDYSKEEVRSPREKAPQQEQQLSANQRPSRAPMDNVALNQAMTKGEKGRSAKG